MDPRSDTRHGGYELPVQASRSFGAVEQHGNARVALAHFDNDAGKISELGASSIA